MKAGHKKIDECQSNVRVTVVNQQQLVDIPK